MDIQLFLTLALALLGLLFGSFANVCVHRIPRGKSITLPSSHCPKCQSSIAWYDNIPLISWLLLGRKCRSCATSISWRYPLLELTMALLWAAIAWFYPPYPNTFIFFLQAIFLVSMLWVLTLIDIETFLLPDVITLPGIIIGLFFSWQLGYLADAVIGAIAGYAIFWLVAHLFFRMTSRQGMGQGDFKLLAMLGAFMGWKALPFIILLSSLTGVVIGTATLLAMRKGLQTEIPYGPYLAIAGMIWFFWSVHILDWYQGFMFNP